MLIGKIRIPVMLVHQERIIVPVFNGYGLRRIEIGKPVKHYVFYLHLSTWLVKCPAWLSRSGERGVPGVDIGIISSFFYKISTR